MESNNANELFCTECCECKSCIDEFGDHHAEHEKYLVRIQDYKN